MLTKRIIACLDVKDGVVVKGVRFRNHEVMGDPVELAKRYRDEGADELVFYDITASADGRRVEKEWVVRVAKALDIPFCVAGGLRTVADAREVLRSGADKISINSPALERPALIAEMAAEFGVQCVVVGIDSRRVEGEYVCYRNTGSEAKTAAAGRKTMEWAREAESLGAGELVLNCMDQDGVGGGYDLAQLSLLRETVSIPIVASGGARTVEHFERVFKEARVDAALAAGAFHRRELLIPDLKRALKERQIEIRI